MQNNIYETLILVASGARHDKENIFAKFKRQNCGETLAHDSCIFLQSQRLDSGVSSHSLRYGTEVLPHHLESSDSDLHPTPWHVPSSLPTVSLPPALAVGGLFYNGVSGSG